MRLYNTLSRSEEPFAPSVDNTVRMYTCGLTTYARGHIGNFRTFICVDVLRRTLKYLLGYRVKQVMNFTDVDDRTIAGANNAGQELTYCNVVRNLTPAGMWHGEAAKIVLPRSSVIPEDCKGWVALLQEGKVGPVIGAATSGSPRKARAGRPPRSVMCPRPEPPRPSRPRIAAICNSAVRAMLKNFTSAGLH
jgi:cysteinyl-tRNA synthetase